MFYLVYYRLSVIVMLGISVAWVVLLSSRSEDQIFIAIHKAGASLAPPICAMIVAAMFWSRATEPVRKARCIWGCKTISNQGSFLSMLHLALQSIYELLHISTMWKVPSTINNLL